MVCVIDTHALVWYLVGKTRRHFQPAVEVELDLVTAGF